MVARRAELHIVPTSNAVRRAHMDYSLGSWGLVVLAAPGPVPERAHRPGTRRARQPHA
jgi:hypothetical protein